MNRIVIKAPRWRDRKVLVADWKIGQAKNEIVIEAAKKDGTRFYPEPIITTGQQLKSYPLEKMPHGNMRVVALDDLL